MSLWSPIRSLIEEQTRAAQPIRPFSNQFPFPLPFRIGIGIRFFQLSRRVNGKHRSQSHPGWQTTNLLDFILLSPKAVDFILAQLLLRRSRRRVGVFF